MSRTNKIEDEQIESAIAGYDTLTKIVEQLELGGYEAEGGPLINNAAFIALKRLAEIEDAKA